MLSAPEPLAAEHRVDDFSSGTASLDDWLGRRALANQVGGASRTYVVVDAGRRFAAMWITRFCRVKRVPSA